jgi:hypothetical protein
MSRVLQPYSSRNMTITWGSLTFKGIVEDSFLVVTPNADVSSTVVGADGTAAPAQSPNGTGTIQIQLLQGEPTSKVLAGILYDQLYGSKIFKIDPMLIVDPSGSTYVDAKSCWIQARPELTRSASNDNAETWTFFSADLRYIPNPSQVPAAVSDQVDDLLAGALAVLNATR